MDPRAAKSVVLSHLAVPAWQGLCATADAASAGIKDVADLGDPAKTALLDTDGDGRGEIWIGASTWKSTGNRAGARQQLWLRRDRDAGRGRGRRRHGRCRRRRGDRPADGLLLLRAASRLQAARHRASDRTCLRSRQSGRSSRSPTIRSGYRNRARRSPGVRSSSTSPIRARSRRSIPTWRRFWRRWISSPTRSRP